MKLFDSHCHLQMAQFDTDRVEVLARMREVDMGAVVIGTDLQTSRDAILLANQNEFLFASIGLHPSDNPEEVFDRAAYEVLVRHPKVVAVGECGLDYYNREVSPQAKALQRERFLEQAVLAGESHKALVIHCRNAHEDMIPLLGEVRSRWPDLPVIIHFFTGSGALAEAYLKLGCTLSFPGPVTFTDMYDDSVRVTPLERLLVETDSPFAAPKPFRGTRNEPAYVRHIVDKIALIKGVTPEEVMAATVANAIKIFGLS